jgi:hypothetical protein
MVGHGGRGGAATSGEVSTRPPCYLLLATCYLVRVRVRVPLATCCLLLTAYLGRCAHVAHERRREKLEGPVHKGEGRVRALGRAPFLAVVGAPR